MIDFFDSLILWFSVFTGISLEWSTVIFLLVCMVVLSLVLLLLCCAFDKWV